MKIASLKTIFQMWFPQGLDTPGICMIRVSASRIQYWHKEEEGEFKAA